MEPNDIRHGDYEELAGAGAFVRWTSAIAQVGHRLMVKTIVEMSLTQGPL